MIQLLLSVFQDDFNMRNQTKSTLNLAEWLIKSVSEHVSWYDCYTGLKDKFLLNCDSFSIPDA